MSVPLDLTQQKKQNWFKPNKKIGFYLGLTKYDNIGIELGDIQEPIPNMDDVKQQVLEFKACMEKYHVREEDSALLLDPPPYKVNKELDKINKQLREGKSMKPSKNIFIVMLFAGIGVQYEGAQARVYNEFNKKGEIALLKAEAKIRC